MKSITLKVAAGVLILGSVAACNNTPAEKAAENTADMMEESADAVRDNSEMKADNMEDKADTLDNRVDGMDSKAEQNMENRAAAVRSRLAFQQAQEVLARHAPAAARRRCDRCSAMLR